MGLLQVVNNTIVVCRLWAIRFSGGKGMVGVGKAPRWGIYKGALEVVGVSLGEGMGG